MSVKYKPKGVCSSEITFNVENGIVTEVKFESGCEGNLQGLSKLIEGMPADLVISKLKGIDCDGRGTSCPDQLAKALEKAAAQSNTGIA